MPPVPRASNVSPRKQPHALGGVPVTPGNEVPAKIILPKQYTIDRDKIVQYFPSKLSDNIPPKVFVRKT